MYYERRDSNHRNILFDPTNIRTAAQARAGLADENRRLMQLPDYRYTFLALWAAKDEKIKHTELPLTVLIKMQTAADAIAQDLIWADYTAVDINPHDVEYLRRYVGANEAATWSEVLATYHQRCAYIDHLSDQSETDTPTFAETAAHASEESASLETTQFNPQPQITPELHREITIDQMLALPVLFASSEGTGFTASQN